jgi:thiol-disulfide isomerase/thioredoxin
MMEIEKNKVMSLDGEAYEFEVSRRFSLLMIGMLMLSVFMVGGVLGQGADVESQPLAIPNSDNTAYIDPFADTTVDNDKINNAWRNANILNQKKLVETLPFYIDPITGEQNIPADVVQDVIESSRKALAKSLRNKLVEDLTKSVQENGETGPGIFAPYSEDSSEDKKDVPLELTPLSPNAADWVDKSTAGTPDPVNGESTTDPSTTEEDSFFPKSECVEQGEDDLPFDANSFLQQLGAKPVETGQESESGTKDGGPTLDPNNIEKEGEKYALAEGDFKASDVSRNETYIAQMKAFNALEGKNKQDAWNEISKTPELKKRFLNTLQEKYSGEGENEKFKLFDTEKIEDLPDIDWAEGGQMRVGAKEGKGGVLVDLCSIEKYNELANGDDNSFKFNLEGAEYEGKNSPLTGINYVSDNRGSGFVEYTFENGAIMEVEGAKGDSGRMYDLENRKLLIGDSGGNGGTEATWMNNRGRVSLLEDGKLIVGMSDNSEGKLDPEGRDFGIVKVGEGEDLRILSPFQKRIDELPSGIKLDKSKDKNVFARLDQTGKTYSLNSDEQAFVVEDAQYSLIDGKEHYVNSYAEVAGEGGNAKGQFFFGKEIAVKEGEDRKLNNFVMTKNKDGKLNDVALNGNLFYEQTANMGDIIMGDGEQKIVNGDYVVSRKEDGTLETRSLTGKKGGAGDFDGTVFTESDKADDGIDTLVMKDKDAIGNRLVQEEATEEEKKKAGGKKDTNKGVTGDLSEYKVGSSTYTTGKKNIYSGNMEELLTQAKDKNQKVLLKFGTVSCGPCQQYNPLVTNFAKSNTDVLVIDIDAERNPNLFQQFGGESVPFTVGIDSGRLLTPQTGYRDANFLSSYF